jgi:hypothetical protein
MDFGIDTIIYLIIGIIFVLAQATRKRKVSKGSPPVVTPEPHEEQNEVKEELSAFWKEFLGADLTANQVTEPVAMKEVPPVIYEPEVFQRMEPAPKVQVSPASSFTDPVLVDHDGMQEPESQSGGRKNTEYFDLRSAVIYSAILERKYA